MKLRLGTPWRVDWVGFGGLVSGWRYHRALDCAASSIRRPESRSEYYDGPGPNA
jgi:hypothetical protein